MNFNKFTIKSQEAVQNAQEIAASYSNQTISNSASQWYPFYSLVPTVSVGTRESDAQHRKEASSMSRSRYKFFEGSQPYFSLAAIESGAVYEKSNVQKMLELEIKKS